MIQKVAEIKNKKVRSTVNSYMMLLEDMDVNTLEDICEVYDYLMDKAFDSKEDKPDGKLFRKNEISITDGLEQIHKGFYPEQNIILGMKEFLALYLDGRKDIFLRMIICHFLLETIHPYYDGNGRLGRLLFSLQLYKEEHTVFSLCIAQSIYKQKSKYYKALSNGRDIHEFGCLNQFVMDMGEILIEGMDNLLSQLKENQNRYFELSRKDWNISFSISERKVFDLLLQASCFGMFGLSNSQIMSELQISKRTVISTIKKFRENNLLSETTLGKVTYHRIVNFEIDE